MKNESAKISSFVTMLSAVAVLVLLLFPAAMAQQTSRNDSGGATGVAGVTIRGRVLDSDSKPVSDAVVRLGKKDSSGSLETQTDAVGAFVFLRLSKGSYRVSAEKAELRSRTAEVIVSTDNDAEKVDLILERNGSTADAGASAVHGAQTMTFSDQPNFTVAGVTDWTAVGGHGSDSTLRTSESLASETATLKPDSVGHGAGGVSGEVNKEAESKLRAALASAPGDFDANHRLGVLYLRAGRYAEAILLLESAYRIDPADAGNQYDLGSAYEGAGDLAKAKGRIGALLAKQESADLHRLMGEVDEKSGDPLSAVHEFAQAAKLSPSEQNYFEWGSELLLHRAVWQALEVFHKGADAYPKSARMQTALGTALFAGARYEEAALHLCSASDLNPADPNPYLFMGKIQMAAPNSLACVEPKLARFVQQQPGNATANYLYAMAILKRQGQPDRQAVQHAEALLTKAVTIDSKCSEAYLQLGILSASQRDLDKAIGFYTKAIDADPELADAHYRLGVAYDRTGQPAKAKQEFLLHDQMKQRQADAVERQRREVKQFLFAQPGAPVSSSIQ